MNPFFFGSSAQPLFGVYHPPKSDVGRPAGVVLCYPMGQEYMRAHRAFRQLALLLSRSGFHVMRFDYYGTGDSAGDGQDASAERWMDDIGTALDEMKDTADVDELAVVGLRMGATLAAYAAGKRSDVGEVVLWDPIWSGKEYMNEVLADHAGITLDATSRKKTPPDLGTVGLMGFPVSPVLRRGIEKLKLGEGSPGSAGESFVVVSSDCEDQQALAAAYHAGSDKGTFMCVPSEGNWNEVDNFGSALIPQAIIREIVKYLSDRIRA